MKKLILFYLFLSLSFVQAKLQANTTALNSNPFGVELFSDNENTVFIEYYPNGNVKQFFLVQGIVFNEELGDILDIKYNEGENIEVVTDAKTIKFSVNSQSSLNLFAVQGIAHYSILDELGEPKDKLLKLMNPSLGSSSSGSGSGLGKCGDECLAGGCGATDCSRTVGPVSCQVSCSAGNFACCGDLVATGCHCKNNACCRQ